MSEQNKTSRTDFIKQIVAVPAAAAAVAAISTSADAAAKSSKAQLKYVDKSPNAMKCAGCALYLPNKNPKANGQCKIVAGSINPGGYCIAYQAKH